MLNIIANESHVVIESYNEDDETTEMVYIPYCNVKAVNYKYELVDNTMWLFFTIETFDDGEYEFTDTISEDDFDDYEETLAINCEAIMNKMQE